MSPDLSRDFTFTASNLQTFRTCKYKFYLRYIQHVPWPAQITLDSIQFEADREAGVRFHQLLHQYYLGFNPEQLMLVAENDPDPRIATWFRTFLRSPYSQLQGDLQPEKSLHCTIDRYRCMAKFDLLHIEPNQLTIYDWKTSKKPPLIIALKETIQTKLYPLVLRRTQFGSRPIQFVYWELNQPDSPFILNITADDLLKVENEITTLCDEVTMLDKLEFVKTVEIKRCAYCEYRSLCDRGSQAPRIENIEDIDFFDFEAFQNLGNEDGNLV